MIHKGTTMLALEEEKGVLQFDIRFNQNLQQVKIVHNSTLSHPFINGLRLWKLAKSVIKETQRWTNLLEEYKRNAKASKHLRKLAQKCLPFFKTIKNHRDFKWMTKCEQTFKKLKKYLMRLPKLNQAQGNTLSVLGSNKRSIYCNPCPRIVQWVVHQLGIPKCWVELLSI